MIFKKLSIAAAVATFCAPTFAQAATHTEADLQKQINQLQQEINQLQVHKAKAEEKTFLAIPISTTPLLGVESTYDGSDLISNFSAINEDLTLLKTRHDEEAAMDPQEATAHRPRMLFSGFINLDAAYLDPQFFGAGLHQTSLNITAAALDTTAYISPWVNAFVELKWNSTPAGQNTIKANRAFITLGKLNRSPFYASIGTMYLPFGRYSTAMVSDPITKQMGRALSTQGAILAGFSKPNVSAQVFGFSGNSKINNKADDVFGADANYYANYGHGKAQLGAGLINNLSESIGLQGYLYYDAATANVIPTGFTGQNMAKQVPAYDLNAQASYDAFVVTTEFIGTTTAYANSDLSFNNAGAKPKAFHIEGLYNFTMIHRPSNAGLFFDHTAQALGLAMPQNSFGVVFNTEVAKDLQFAAQYSHNTDYKTTDSATATPAISATGTGKAQNIYYLQLAAYF